eukprot:1236496-Pyramimonas_sp.AAC.1
MLPDLGQRNILQEHETLPPAKLKNIEGYPPPGCTRTSNKHTRVPSPNRSRSCTSVRPYTQSFLITADRY